MAVFIVLWPYLLTTKLKSVIRHNLGHSNIQSCLYKRLCLTSIVTLFQKSEIDLKQLNSSITTDVKNLDTGFDLIFALLAFHHLKSPETMLNQVLKDNYLNPGGRILIMDYERDPKKQIFHPIHLINGEHYEHDGFTEKIVRDWFEKGK